LEFIKAFIVGGIICVIGQILIDLTKLTPARIMVLFVVAGVVLGILGIYPMLVEWGGSRSYRTYYRVWKCPCKRSYRRC
jgi:stage V sporulation protein AE